MPSIPMAIRGGLIATLAALGLAIGFVAEQERATTAVLQGGAIELAAVPGKLRVALALLLASFAALGYLLYALSRRKGAANEAETEEAKALLATAAASAPVAFDTGLSASILPSTEAGQMLAAGALIRRLCHELTNALSPIQGFAELLDDDERLSEPHRRQAARIGEATAAALHSVHDFAAALSWSNDRATTVHLGALVRTAVAAARSAIGRPIGVAVHPGRDVQITASEAEAGQAILHLCAAAAPLLGERDVRLEIQVDSIVGTATSSTDDTTAGQRLEIWSDPFEPERTKVQFGAMQGSRRYGRVQFTCTGHGWPRDLVSRLFDADLSGEHDSTALSMTVLGDLMLELGGVVMIDSCPLRHLLVTLMWPARIGSGVAAPLEIDTAEDDLDALIIHEVEPAAESLSRRLGDFGLRVASTTSPEAGLDLIAEMGIRCRAILIGETPDPALRMKVSAIRPDAMVLSLQVQSESQDSDADVWHIDPDRDALGRLAARLRRHNAAGAAS